MRRVLPAHLGVWPVLPIKEPFQGAASRNRFKAPLKAQFQVYNLIDHAPRGLPGAMTAPCVDCTSGEPEVITGVDSAVSGARLPYMRTLQFRARLEFQ